MFDSFHIISIKYIDEKGLHHQKKIKVDNNDKFIDLIYELKKNKN